VSGEMGDSKADRFNRRPKGVSVSASAPMNITQRSFPGESFAASSVLVHELPEAKSRVRRVTDMIEFVLIPSSSVCFRNSFYSCPLSGICGACRFIQCVLYIVLIFVTFVSMITKFCCSRLLSEFIHTRVFSNDGPTA